MNDQQILERLKEIDEGDKKVTPWEAKFLETVLGQNGLSDKQRGIAKQMIEKYWRRS